MGQVEALAGWLTRAERGTYFKWQVANRLGRIAKRLGDVSGVQGRQPSDVAGVEQYLEAGTNYSFVDFLARKKRFPGLTGSARSALDMDISKVADYLESQMEDISVRHR